MRVNFTARHYKSSQRLKDYATNEVKRLEKYYDGIIDCDIILDYQKELQIAEIIVKVFGSKLAVTEKTDDIYKSIDLAVEKLERQLVKYKEKHFQQFDVNEIKKT
ncbi:ribosome-associated translation inhibitor RaiA [candidate division KSB1 bacterium]|jgi:putative sigma-54 modulation protein|nr:ribosome-associated translation inhibitor RaiA [candidate division KSB1 bacterium]